MKEERPDQSGRIFVGVLAIVLFAAFVILLFPLPKRMQFAAEGIVYGEAVGPVQVEIRATRYRYLIFDDLLKGTVRITEEDGTREYTLSKGSSSVRELTNSGICASVAYSGIRKGANLLQMYFDRELNTVVLVKTASGEIQHCYVCSGGSADMVSTMLRLAGVN